MNPLFIRILVSLGAGFLLGLERQIHRQPAGLKTHILICTGSTLLMLLSIQMSESISLVSGNPGDPGRLAAQVVSGIGFLGGGAIIRQGFNIKGLTTAATIWVSAAIGLAIGSGFYFPAALTLFLVLVTLVIMERFEAHFFPAKNIKTLYLIYDERYFNYKRLEEELALLKISIGNMDVSKTVSSDRIKISLQVHIPSQIDIPVLMHTLQKIGKLEKMELTAHEKSH